MEASVTTSAPLPSASSPGAAGPAPVSRAEVPSRDALSDALAEPSPPSLACCDASSVGSLPTGTSGTATTYSALTNDSVVACPPGSTAPAPAPPAPLATEKTRSATACAGTDLVSTIWNTQRTCTASPAAAAAAASASTNSMSRKRKTSGGTSSAVDSAARSTCSGSTSLASSDATARRRRASPLSASLSSVTATGSLVGTNRRCAMDETMA
mmetsp:Transcript_9980/g.34970  ORF Transcript_9980/g.34970 Transcript_9980/m.34970 type:complete len:212 (+) Transcript_9980:667-1302(+)